MSKALVSAVIVEKGGKRFVETTYANGEVILTLVDPNKKPTRRPHRPHKRTRVTDYTRNKRF